MGGRSKPRSKGVNVTKQFLQATSVADHITVQVGPSLMVQVGEEELSPTQGSAAAFALRRDRKLDSTLRLCPNWRQGSCHSFAACVFAHVNGYFNVVGDVCSASTHNDTHGPSSSASSVTPQSSAADAAGLQGAAARSWLQRVGPQTLGSDSSPGTTPGKRAAPAAARMTGSLPLKAQWGTQQQPFSDSGKSGVGFVDLQTAMAVVERQNSTPGMSKRAAIAAAAAAAAAAATTSDATGAVSSATPSAAATSANGGEVAPRSPSVAPVVPRPEPRSQRSSVGAQRGREEPLEDGHTAEDTDVSSLRTDAVQFTSDGAGAAVPSTAAEAHHSPSLRRHHADRTEGVAADPVRWLQQRSEAAMAAAPSPSPVLSSSVQRASQLPSTSSRSQGPNGVASLTAPLSTDLDGSHVPCPSSDRQRTTAMDQAEAERAEQDRLVDSILEEICRYDGQTIRPQTSSPPQPASPASTDDIDLENGDMNDVSTLPSSAADGRLREWGIYHRPKVGGAPSAAAGWDSFPHDFHKMRSGGGANGAGSPVPHPASAPHVFSTSATSANGGGGGETTLLPLSAPPRPAFGQQQPLTQTPPQPPALPSPVEVCSIEQLMLLLTGEEETA